MKLAAITVSLQFRRRGVGVNLGASPGFATTMWGNRAGKGGWRCRTRLLSARRWLGDSKRDRHTAWFTDVINGGEITRGDQVLLIAHTATNPLSHGHRLTNSQIEKPTHVVGERFRTDRRMGCGFAM
jgi:hypothetical protein